MRQTTLISPLSRFEMSATLRSTAYRSCQPSCTSVGGSPVYTEVRQLLMKGLRVLVYYRCFHEVNAADKYGSVCKVIMFLPHCTCTYQTSIQLTLFEMIEIQYSILKDSVVI